MFRPIIHFPHKLFQFFFSGVGRVENGLEEPIIDRHFHFICIDGGSLAFTLEFGQDFVSFKRRGFEVVTFNVIRPQWSAA